MGLVDGDLLLDLCYQEDFDAQVDFNVVMTDRGELVELQGATEGAPFPRHRAEEALALAARGMEPCSLRNGGRCGKRGSGTNYHWLFGFYTVFEARLQINIH